MIDGRIDEKLTTHVGGRDERLVAGFELKDEIARTRTEFRDELRHTRVELKQDLQGMESRLVAQIARLGETGIARGDGEGRESIDED